MKKINYFGTEYTVSDDVKWVATCPSGDVITFTERPWIILDAWAAPGGSSRIGISPPAALRWKVSLRKVEDILVKEETPAPSGHPHADLILKYAMIAQYDPEPWKHFEYETSIGWTPCLSMAAFNENVNYRLKPQEPVIQVSQKWVSKEGVEVTVNVQSNKETIVFIYKVGGVTHITSLNIHDFLKNFKRKE